MNSLTPKRESGFTRTLIVILIVMAALAVGYGIRIWMEPAREAPQPSEDKSPPDVDKDILFWTCAMHPEIHQPGPGRCPKCHMELIPVQREMQTEDLGPRQIRLSKAATELAQVETATAERKFVTAEVRMVGKVNFDETRLADISAWVPGRIDRLYVDYTGIAVRKGDHMVDLYSPDLLVAQRELLAAHRVLQEMADSSIANLRESAQRDLESAREKLHLWGLAQEQIETMEKLDQPEEHVTIYAPMGGIVIQKNAVEGTYVNTGTGIYTIADLSQVWVKLDAYESDLAWLRYGQEAQIETEAYPGEVFKGMISFIDPVLNPMTRTVKVRVNVPNGDGRLKPEMFVRGIVRASVARGGKVMSPSLEGKFVCPMHPEVIRDAPGDCNICGMPLVPPESLGYVTISDATGEAPLVIPSSAPLITGKRAVVYVTVPGKEGVFEGKEIILGPRAGDYYIVDSGLEEGEQVVVNGNFKIDSAMQILAEPSMMNPEGGAVTMEHVHGSDNKQPEDGKPRAETQTAKLEIPQAFKEKIDDLFLSYFAIHGGLSRDSLPEAVKAGKEFVAKLDSVDMTILPDEAHMVWMKQLGELRNSADGIAKGENIDKAREFFASLSGSMTALAKRFGASGKQPIYRLHCPMAFNQKGADWLQNKKDTLNPYFGSAMPECGTLEETIVGPRGESQSGK